MIGEAFPGGLCSGTFVVMSNDDTTSVQSLSVLPALNYNISTFYLEDFDDTLTIGQNAPSCDRHDSGKPTLVRNEPTGALLPGAYLANLA